MRKQNYEQFEKDRVLAHTEFKERECQWLERERADEMVVEMVESGAGPVDRNRRRGLISERLCRLWLAIEEQ